tara:strand:+ start:130 stop:378 length:249 start_codon:yes stop_codon:yes gene_type:complete
MRGKMNSRYPQDSNIIDFIEVKMLQLVEQYSAVGKDDIADACWNALSGYVSGSIDIIFKHGQPFVIDREYNDATIFQEDDLT